jgi:hypothetical protein
MFKFKLRNCIRAYRSIEQNTIAFLWHSLFLTWDVFVFWKWFLENHFSNFSVFICHYKSWLTENAIQSKKNLAWFPEKCFPFILDGKHFSKIVKNLEMSYYLLIISNLILKLLIAIYIYFVLNIFFSISSLRI